VISLSERLRPN